MANFNAGAIEATLTLDRSAFSKDLKEAQAQAKKFEDDKIKVPVALTGLEDFTKLSEKVKDADSEKIEIPVKLTETEQFNAMFKKTTDKDETIEIPIKADATEATVVIDKIKTQLKGISDETVEIDTKVTGEEAIANLLATLKTISDETVNVEVKADANGEIVALKARLKAIPDETVTVEVDTDRGIANIMGGTRALNGMRFAIAGIAGVLPALVPLFAGVAAGAVALAGAVGIVGVGIGAFALVAIPTLTNLKKQLAAVGGDISKLPPHLQALATAQKAFNTARAELGKDSGVETTLAAGYALMAQVLGKLDPIISAVSDTFLDLFLQLGGWVASPEFKGVVDFISNEFGPTFMLLAGIIGDLVQTFGYMVGAFQPFTKDMLGGLKGITDGWVKWAASLKSSDKFQAFLDYVRETGPKVLDFFVSVGSALINVGKALAPLGGPVLGALTGFFNGIAGMDPGVLGAILIGVATAIVLFQAWTAAVAIFNLVMAANPIALIVIAIIALGVALVYLFNNNKTFHDLVITIWDAIGTAIGAVVGWITNTAVPAIVAAWNGIVAGVKWLYASWQYVWNLIYAVIAIFVGTTITVVTTFWNTVKNLWSGGFAVLTAAAKLAFAWFLGGWKLIFTSIGTAISTGWTVIKTIFSTAWNVLKTAAGTAWALIKAIFSGKWGEIPKIMSDGWTKIKGYFSDGAGKIKTAVSDGLSSIIDNAKGFGQSIIDAVGDLGSTLYNAGKSVIQGLIDGIQSLIPNMSGVLKGITDKLPDWKGPAEVDKKILRPSGQMVLDGFMDGINDMIPSVENLLKGVTSGIGDVSMAPLSVNATAGGGAAASGLSQEDFLAALSELADQIRNNTQPLIGEYNDASKPATEVAEEFWFLTKSRG